MKQDIRLRTAKFLWMQGAILSGIMLAFFVLCCVFFVRNAVRWELQSIEEDLSVFSDQAARSGEVPKRGDLGQHAFFILNQEGKYILPRLTRSDESEKLWQEYETKLIYEIQKRHDGWSYYPDRSRWDLNKGQYALRYVFVEKTGWIVVAEGYLPSAVTLLRGLLSPKVFWGMFLFIMAAFVLMLFNANWHFHRIVRIVLRSQENNFIETEKSKPIAESGPFVKPEEKISYSGLIRGAAARGLPKKELAVHEDEVVSLNKPELKKKQPARIDPVFDPRIYDNIGSVTIDTSEIRSPLLRKAIEEMRKVKK